MRKALLCLFELYSRRYKTTRFILTDEVTMNCTMRCASGHVFIKLFMFRIKIRLKFQSE